MGSGQKLMREAAGIVPQWPLVLGQQMCVCVGGGSTQACQSPSESPLALFCLAALWLEEISAFSLVCVERSTAAGHGVTHF